MAKRDPKVKQEAGKKLVTKPCKPTKYTAEFVAQETENMLIRGARVEGKMMVKQGITANGQADF
jgi:hypothetical protein